MKKDGYKVLHLEDVPSDAQLVARELKKSHISFEHLVIDTESEYIDALLHFVPDIILCDHSLPSFNSKEALKIVKEKKLYIPFIVVSAVITDENGMSIIREGADDYILKDRLHRLPHAFINAIEKYRFEKESVQKLDEAHEREVLAKESLRKNAEERERLLAELTKSIVDLKQFTYITSHNFKAPLSNLIGLLNLINDNTLDENNKAIINMFKTSTQQINKTINDLVTILIIRNNVNINMGSNDVENLVNKVTNLLAYEINKNNCRLNVDLKVHNIEFNKPYLESILMNLLSNAIKYQSPHRALQIDITTSLNAKKEVVLTIGDNGLGIDLKRHGNYMFGLYQRFHSNTDGAGLGLFMVKSQITSLGGTIEVESEEDKGTTFFITFKKKVEQRQLN